jgi:hypothetical protein
MEHAKGSRLRLRLRVAVLISFVSMACANQPAPPVPAAEAASPATASPTDEAASAAVPVVTKFGVPECDAYVEKYTLCVEGKVPPADKERLLAGFEANRTKWRAMATMKESAVALGLACRAAAQKAKEEMLVEYGCEF